MRRYERAAPATGPGAWFHQPVPAGHRDGSGAHDGAGPRSESPTPAPAPAPNASTTANPNAKAQVPAYEGQFKSDTLAGGTVNKFSVAQASTNLKTVTTKLKWCANNPNNFDRLECNTEDNGIFVSTKAPENAGIEAKTSLGIQIPAPPGWFPLAPIAEITIEADTAEGPKTLFHGSLPVSVLWFPLAVTLLVVAFVYPGCSAGAWYVGQRRYLKQKQTAKPNEKVSDPPSFWASLDPVELTKNPYGRGSIAKLQIFLFSFIVFALLLFHALRTGLLANMSVDLLYLMGLSAYGAAGGKLASVANRRLSLENWAWLRRKGWLTVTGDVANRAKWSDLFIDSDTKEVDPYRFQMAIFSLVVGVALIKTSATGLDAFHIPNELLALLGISQTIFIGGQAIDRGGYQELDKKLDDVRKHEDTYRELKAKAKPAAPAPAPDALSVGQVLAGKPQSPDGEQTAPTSQDVDAERKAFKAGVAQAKEMFVAIYGQQIGTLPLALRQADRMEPEEYDQVGTQDYTADLVTLRNTYYGGARETADEKGYRGR